MLSKWVIEYRIKPDGHWNLVAGEDTLVQLGKTQLIRLASSILDNGVKFKISDIEYRLRNIETEEKMNEAEIRESALPPLERH